MEKDTQETVIVTTDSVGCDGGGGQLGHPMVFLRLNAQGKAVCPYCSRQFVLADGVKLDSHAH